MPTISTEHWTTQMQLKNLALSVKKFLKNTSYLRYRKEIDSIQIFLSERKYGVHCGVDSFERLILEVEPILEQFKVDPINKEEEMREKITIDDIEYDVEKIARIVMHNHKRVTDEGGESWCIKCGSVWPCPEIILYNALKEKLNVEIK